jgi:thioredoxin 1
MSSSPNVKTVDDASFENEVLKSPIPVLVDFGATWCGPCKALAPIVGKIADDFQGKVKVVSVDIDDASETAKKYAVKSVPMCVVFNGGQKGASQAGLSSRETLLKLLGL